MDRSAQKVVQYLHEAHASELALTRVLGSQVAMTPSGGLRNALEAHLHETRNHAQRVRGRLNELGYRANPLQVTASSFRRAAGQAFALGKTPIDLLRGSGGEEKVLKNARDACATESLEIASYAAIEQLARATDDLTTAELAVSIRRDEEAMLARLMDELPQLAATVVRADVHEREFHDASPTSRARVRKPWPGYDEHTAAQVRETLADADARQARIVRDYERAHKNRAGVIQAAERELTQA